MIANSRFSKGCDPQLLSQPPEQDWALETLGQYSQAQRDRIDHSECSLAILYWRLGAALTYARRQFDHGQWSLYLQQLGIERTRASKARAIYKSFPNENSLQGVSVEDAYQSRKRKKSSMKRRRRSRKRFPSSDPAEVLCELCEQVIAVQIQVSEMSSVAAGQLLSIAEAAQIELEKLVQTLKLRCESTS